MGWNCSITIVPGATLDDLRRAGAAVAADRIYGEHALTSGFDGVAAGEMDGNLVLLASEPIAGVDELASHLGREAFDTMFSSVSDTYVWRVVGPSGTRLLVSSEGETVASNGTRHPAEAELDGLDEDGLFGLLERATGFVAVFDGSAEPNGGGFHPAELPTARTAAPADGTPCGPTPARRRWFRRR